MSKGIVNNRDKFIWDNSHKPDISDVVDEIDGEMDDLLEDHDDKIVDIVGDSMDDLLTAHDDKVVDIVGDNMDDLLTAHDDKVVDIVGDNMSTLLTSAASTVQLIAGDLSTVTTTEFTTIGTLDATHSLIAKRYTGSFATATDTQSIALETLTAGDRIFRVDGYVARSTGVNMPISYMTYVGNQYSSSVFIGSSNDLTIRVGLDYSEGTYDIITIIIRATT